MNIVASAFLTFRKNAKNLHCFSKTNIILCKTIYNSMCFVKQISDYSRVSGEIFVVYKMPIQIFKPR